MEEALNMGAKEEKAASQGKARRMREVKGVPPGVMSWFERVGQAAVRRAISFMPRPSEFKFVKSAMSWGNRRVLARTRSMKHEPSPECAQFHRR
jgi:hypothetical protein